MMFVVCVLSGVVCANLRSVRYVGGFHDFIMSNYFCPSFWCVIMAFEVH